MNLIMTEIFICNWNIQKIQFLLVPKIACVF